MQRELASFPIPPLQKSKLQQAGFTVAQDITALKPSELSQEIGISMEEALALIKLVRNETEKILKPSSKDNATRRSTALEMLRDERSHACIITFSQALDSMLGGGVPIASITEFCGAPGVGKTQVSMQLCVDVQIPEVFGGLSGEAVYIDTEGSFLVERLSDIAQASVTHCAHMCAAQPCEEYESAMKSFTLESVLAGIHYFRCHSYTELIALVYTLPDFLKEHKKVRLIVIDSVAFHFRHDLDDYALRTRLLNGLAQSCSRLAAQYCLAVVLTNQMTTRISQSKGATGSHLVPALGESWGHACTTRVILYWKGSERQALLYKSPSKAETSVPFQITTGGIRDITTAAENSRSQPNTHPNTQPGNHTQTQSYNQTITPTASHTRAQSSNHTAAQSYNNSGEAQNLQPMKRQRVT